MIASGRQPHQLVWICVSQKYIISTEDIQYLMRYYYVMTTPHDFSAEHLHGIWVLTMKANVLSHYTKHLSS